MLVIHAYFELLNPQPSAKDCSGAVLRPACASAVPVASLMLRWQPSTEECNDVLFCCGNACLRPLAAVAWNLGKTQLVAKSAFAFAVSRAPRVMRAQSIRHSRGGIPGDSRVAWNLGKTQFAMK